MNIEGKQYVWSEEAGELREKKNFQLGASQEKREPVRLSRWQIANNTGEVGKGKQQKKENKRKLIFWNVAGIERQDKGFWNYIQQVPILQGQVRLCETWLQDKGWDRFKDRLPDTHN